MSAIKEILVHWTQALRIYIMTKVIPTFIDYVINHIDCYVNL